MPFVKFDQTKLTFKCLTSISSTIRGIQSSRVCNMDTEHIMSTAYVLHAIMYYTNNLLSEFVGGFQTEKM